MNIPIWHKLYDRRGVTADGFPSTYGDPLCREAADTIEELLEALLDLTERPCSLETLEPMLARARVAIAKARGEVSTALPDA